MDAASNNGMHPTAIQRVYQFELINDSGDGFVIDIGIPYREFKGE